MRNMDVRWVQRFQNYCKALDQLDLFASKGSALSEMEEQGLIKAFEYTYELAWTTLKDYLQDQGHQDITGSKDAIRRAFKVGIILDGDMWMDMLASRNKTTHTYNQDTASEVKMAILNVYLPLFKSLHATLAQIIQKNEH